MAKALSVVKCNPAGEEIFRWSGVELARAQDEVLIEARFNVPIHHVGGMTLKAGDRLVESYYSQRWFNIFEVYAGGNDEFRGWYCNLSYPAKLGEREIRFRDLALDLIVYPDGREELLDEDEFDALEISAQDREAALHGLELLKIEIQERMEK